MHNSAERGVRFQRGFTLAELIAVMVIVGILAAVAAPRFFGNDVFQSRGAADQVRAALRFGQKAAIAQHRAVTVNISAAPNPTCDAVVGGAIINCVIPDTVTISPTTLAVTFNSLGQPNVAAAITVGTTAINVEAETGYVH